MSANYLAPEEFDRIDGTDNLSAYQFGDRDVNHLFCKTCGICPFITVASVPSDYAGPARPGHYRVNLGCIDNLDLGQLEMEAIDGRSL